MDTKIQPKENAGSVGTGFEGKTGSNSYSALPRSSNVDLGIDPEVATGVGYAVSNTTGYNLNVGQKETKSSRKNLGYDEPWATGTYGETENDGGYGPSEGAIAKNSRGQWGATALPGSRTEGSTSDSLGTGARAKGTAGNEGGTPGRSGSMAFAAKGLSATGPSSPAFKPQMRAGSSKSMKDADAGIQKKATW